MPTGYTAAVQDGTVTDLRSAGGEHDRPSPQEPDHAQR